MIEILQNNCMEVKKRLFAEEWYSIVQAKRMNETTLPCLPLVQWLKEMIKIPVPNRRALHAC